jgi:hypothetical protein
MSKFFEPFSGTAMSEDSDIDLSTPNVLTNFHPHDGHLVCLFHVLLDYGSCRTFMGTTRTDAFSTRYYYFPLRAHLKEKSDLRKWTLNKKTSSSFAPETVAPQGPSPRRIWSPWMLNWIFRLKTLYVLRHCDTRMKFMERAVLQGYCSLFST